MTDIVWLAHREFRRIMWQETTEEYTQDDLREDIAEAIRDLYIHIGRGSEEIEAKFVYEDIKDDDDNIVGRTVIGFEDDLTNAEQKWVILTAMIMFFKLVQSNYNGLVSYTTDAMAVTHGDKPYANLKDTIANLEAERNNIWWRMVNYNML